MEETNLPYEGSAPWKMGLVGCTTLKMAARRQAVQAQPDRVVLVLFAEILVRIFCSLIVSDMIGPANFSNNLSKKSSRVG